MKALMKDKANAKMFRDAIKSPLGSTARARAQKVFTIMNKLQGNHDGMGGPGMMMERYEQPQETMQSTDDTPQSMVVFHKLPKFYVNYDGVARPDHEATNDGTGGPGYGPMDGEGGVGDWLGGALDAFGNAAGAVGGAVVQGAENLISPVGSAIYNASEAAKNVPAASQTNLQYLAGLPATAIDTAGSALGNAAKAVGSGVVGAAQSVGNAVTGAVDWLGAPHANPPLNLGPNGALPAGLTPMSSTPAPQVIPGETLQQMSIRLANAQNGVKTPTLAYPQIVTALGAKPQVDGTSASPPTLGRDNLRPTANAALSNSNTGFGSASDNYTSALGGADPTMPLKDAITKYGMEAIVNAIVANEGSSPNGVQNNPGNIKYNGLPGQTDSGVQATDGGTFASYSTPDAGKQAIASIVQNAASGQSSSYGANPSLGQFAGTYTNTGSGSSGGGSSGGVAGTSSGGSTGGATGTGYAGVQDAVKSAMGPTMFAMNTEANPKNPVTGGMSEAQIEAQNKADIWKEFGIDALTKQKNDLLATQGVLPKDMTDFIRDQDQYLNQTDKMINDYVAQHSNDQGSPETRAAYVAHLNYLYTLRGAQNTRYINYMGSAIAMNDAKLKSVTDTYTQTLSLAQDALKDKNAITKDVYDTYTKALTDMYTAVEKAPIAAQQYRLVEQQILTSRAQMAADAIKANAQSDYLTMYPKFKDQVYDSNGFAMPIDLVTTLTSFAKSNPDIDSGVILRIYNNTLANTLKAPSGSKDGNGQPVSKTKAVQEGFTNYAKLAGEGVREKDMNTVQTAIGYGDQIAQTYGSILGGEWGIDATLAPKVRNLIGSLGAKGWFGGLATPSRSSFISNAKNQGIDTSMASALYDQFQSYMATPGAKPEDFANSMLNNTTSQTSRVPWTDQELLSHLGQITATSQFSQSLAQSGLQRNPDGSITITSAGSTTSL